MQETNESAEKRVDLTGFPVNDSIVMVPWRGKTIHVRPLIEPEETMEIVDAVLYACMKRGDEVSTIPEMRDFALRSNVITKYSNVDLPSSIREQYKLVYLTDLYETIEKKVCKAQIEAIKSTIDLYLIKS